MQVTDDGYNKLFDKLKACILLILYESITFDFRNSYNMLIRKNLIIFQNSKNPFLKKIRKIWAEVLLKLESLPQLSKFCNKFYVDMNSIFLALTLMHLISRRLKLLVNVFPNCAYTVYILRSKLLIYYFFSRNGRAMPNENSLIPDTKSFKIV